MKNIILICLLFSLSTQIYSATEPITENATGEYRPHIGVNWGNFFSAIKRHLEPANIKRAVKEGIAELEVDFDIDLFDISVIDGIKTSLEYRYELEPSYASGYYTRVDKWRLKSDIDPGTLLSSTTGATPINLNIRANTEVIFVRQFKKQTKAATAIPITLYHLPVNWKRVLKLPVGTFVSIPTKLNLTVGAGLAATSGAVSGSIGGHFIVSGQFLIQIFRLKDKEVRIKLIAVKSKGAGINIGANFGPPIEVFKVDILDNEIKGLVKTDFFKAGLTKTKGDMFIVDFKLNMEHPEAQKAFDHIMGSTLKFRTLKILNPFTRSKRVGELLVTDLGPCQRIFEEDREKPENERRIDRIFKGQNKYKQNDFNIKIGFHLFKLQNKITSSENFITYFDRYDKQSYFLFRTFTEYERNEALFGYFKDKKERGSFILFEADKKGEILKEGFSDFALYHEFKEKNFTRKEQLKVKKFLKSNLPGKLMKEIPWDKLISPVKLPYPPADNSDEDMIFDFGDFFRKPKQRGARVFFQLLFNENAFAQMKNLSKDFISFMLDGAVEKYRFENPYSVIFEDNEDHSLNYNVDINKEKKVIVKALVKIFTMGNLSKYSRRKKVKMFMKLQQNPVFKRICYGFLLSLLNPDTLKDSIQFNFWWSSRNLKDDCHVVFGENPHSELYNSLVFIKSVLENRSFDLRLVGYNPGDFVDDDE